MDIQKIEIKIENLKIERRERVVKISMAQQLGFDAEVSKMQNDVQWFGVIIDELVGLLQFEKKNEMTPDKFKEIIMNAHSAGQRNAGVDPSESQALAYYTDFVKSHQP